MLVEGLVIYKSSRNVRVETADEVLLCSFRGKMRDRRNQLPVVVGDRVTVQPTSSGEAVIETVLPRRNELRRARDLGRELPDWKAGSRRAAGREKTVAANMDQVLIVLAAVSPPPRWGLVDRVLVSAAYEELDAGLCLNKWDQLESDRHALRDVEAALGVYESLGVQVFRSAFVEGRGLDEIRPWLTDKKTVLSGHSGVGKSTMIQGLCPEEEIATGSISQSTGKGKHVTTAARLYSMPTGGYLVDTPGYREYGLLDLEPAQLALYYTEFSPLVSNCRFKDCLHVREPHCAVLEALEAGDISELRYRNYCYILDSLRPGD